MALGACHHVYGEKQLSGVCLSMWLC